MTLAERLHADPTLSVRIPNDGGPCTLRRGGRHFSTLDYGAEAGIVQERGVSRVDLGGSAFREYADDAWLDQTQTLDAPELGADAGDETGPAAEPETLQPVTLPALGEELTQGDLLRRLDVNTGTATANRLRAETTNALVDPTTPQKGRLYTVDATLVRVLGAEGYAVAHDAVAEVVSQAPQETGALPPSCEDEPAVAEAPFGVDDDGEPLTEAEMYERLDDSEEQQPGSDGAAMGADVPTRNIEAGAEAEVEFEAAWTEPAWTEPARTEPAGPSGDGADSTSPEWPPVERTPDGIARVVSALLLDDAGGVLRLLKQETVAVVTWDLRGDAAAAAAHGANAAVMLERLEGVAARLCDELETCRRHLLA